MQRCPSHICRGAWPFSLRCLLPRPGLIVPDAGAVDIGGVSRLAGSQGGRMRVLASAGFGQVFYNRDACQERAALDVLESGGYIFSTVDTDHFKSTDL